MIPIEVKYIIISKLQVLNSVFSIILATLADWNTNAKCFDLIEHESLE